jgi:hypothetical protein
MTTTENGRRPKRRAIPERVKRAVDTRQFYTCACGCGEWYGQVFETPPKRQYDHSPPLALREVNADGTDYMPTQLDPSHIFCLLTGHHAKKTFHPRGPHTSIDSDIHAIAKAKRIAKGGKTRRGRKLRSRGFDKKHTRHFDGKVTRRNP